MRANRTLLRMKYARVILAYAKQSGCSIDVALHDFYTSETYRLMREGVAFMHCMSDDYLVEELLSERSTPSSAPLNA